MPTFLQNLFANIFDVYPEDDFIQKFVKNDSINIDQILTHSFLKLNATYCFIWNYLFKTYPTKKDFYEFAEVNSYDYDSVITLNDKFIEKTLNTFIQLKLGILDYVHLGDFVKSFADFVKNLNDVKFLSHEIYRKWTYRFQIPPTFVSKNLILSFANVLKLFVNPSFGSYSITGYKNEYISYSDADMSYMNEYEKVQYYLYKDNHFFALRINSACIIVDGDIPDRIVSSLCNLCSKITDKTTTIFSEEPFPHDPYFVINIDKELHHILPRIFKICVYVSNKEFPETRSLSYTTEKSIYYLYSSNGEIVQNIKLFDVSEEYDRYIINNIDVFENIVVPKLQKYLVLDFSDDVNILNCKRDTSKRVLVAPFTYEHHRELLDNITNVIICDSCDENQFYDVVVDLYQEFDIKFFVVRGTIPVLTSKVAFVQHCVNGIYVETPHKIEHAIASIIENDAVMKKMKHNCEMLNFVYSSRTFEDFFSYHLEKCCPYRNLDPTNNILIYLNFVYQYFFKKLIDICDIQKPTSPEYCVAIVDNRTSALSMFSILFSLSNLQKQHWVCKIYTSDESFKTYHDALSTICDVAVLPELNIPIFHIDIYNSLLKSESFWESISYSKCLVIQNDGVLLRKGLDNFIDYSYVGAPWMDCDTNLYIKNHVNPKLVGNGGFSLRDVEAMKRICREFESEKKVLFYNNICEQPEDVWTAKCLTKLNYKIPSTKRASFFSSEEILNEASIGFHKVYAYHGPLVVKKYFDGVLKD